MDGFSTDYDVKFADFFVSKFYICPRAFTSRPNIDFSDNTFAVDIISRHTSRLKAFFLCYNAPFNFRIARKQDIMLTFLF